MAAAQNDAVKKQASLLGAFATVSGLTMASRILGFVRDMVIARYLGASDAADAFFIAFRLPNLFRRWFAEGAFNAAFVPVFARTLTTDGEQAAKLFAGRAFSLLAVVLIAMTIAAEIYMPTVMGWLAPGFADDPDKAALTVLYGRIMFPYLTFMAWLALYAGVLNALGKFAAAAAAPIMLNVVLIVVLLGVVPFVAGPPAEWLSYGVAVAGVVQWGIAFVALERHGFHLRPRTPVLSENVKKLLRLMVPGIIAGGVTQINIVVGSIIASAQDGAVSYLYYADRIYQLPLGVIGAAMGVVLLPDLSRRLNAKDETGARNSFNRASETALLLTIPAAVALFISAYPVIAGLFERGAFGREAVAATAIALSAFAVGLPAYVMQRILQPGFFARENTTTPLIYASVNMVVNVALSLYLFPRIGHVGLAIATATAAWVHVLLLHWGLRGEAAFKPDQRLVSRTLRTMLAAFGMGAALMLGGQLLAPYIHGTQIERLGALIVLVGSGGALFGLLAWLFGAFSPRELVQRLMRRNSPA